MDKTGVKVRVLFCCAGMVVIGASALGVHFGSLWLAIGIGGVGVAFVSAILAAPFMSK